MKEIKKKTYITPFIQVVIMHHNCHLLSGSKTMDTKDSGDDNQEQQPVYYDEGW